jgi:hypothetical protein
MEEAINFHKKLKEKYVKTGISNFFLCKSIPDESMASFASLFFHCFVMFPKRCFKLKMRLALKQSTFYIDDF